MVYTSFPFYFPAVEQEFLQKIRDVARGNSVLFHGTSTGSLIARTDTLLIPRVGDPVISFTRSPEAAVHFASLPKDLDDGLPSVFVFNRQSLQSRYRLELHQEPPPDNHQEGKYEMEERVWGRDIRPISRHLIAIIFCLGRRVYSVTSKQEIESVYIPTVDICATASVGIRDGTYCVAFKRDPKLRRA